MNRRPCCARRRCGQETEVLAGKLGHKRLIVVYGEHPESDVDYMAESHPHHLRVKVPARKGSARSGASTCNAAPMRVGS